MRARSRLTSTTASLLEFEAEELLGVIQHDFLSHLWFHINLLKLFQPALNTDGRPVGAEHRLILEQGVDVVDELRRKILGCPTGKIDVIVSLMPGDGQAFRGPRPGRVGANDFEFWKVRRNLVDGDGLAVF